MLPAYILIHIANVDTTMAPGPLLGMCLRSLKKNPNKKVTEKTIRKLSEMAKNLPGTALADYRDEFNEYFKEQYNKHLVEFPEDKNNKGETLEGFTELYRDITGVNETHIREYLDGILDEDSGDNSGGFLQFSVKVSEEDNDVRTMTILPQEASIKRADMDIVSKLMSPSVRQQVYGVGVIQAVMKLSEDTTESDIENFLKSHDLAKAAAIGDICSEAEKRVSRMLEKNFDTMAESFFE